MYKTNGAIQESARYKELDNGRRLIQHHMRHCKYYWLMGHFTFLPSYNNNNKYYYY